MLENEETCFILITMFNVLFQLLACQNRMLELEKEIENPYDEKRVRYLEGKDPPPADLHEKVEDVSPLISFTLGNCLCAI